MGGWHEKRIQNGYEYTIDFEIASKKINGIRQRLKEILTGNGMICLQYLKKHELQFDNRHHFHYIDKYLCDGVIFGFDFHTSSPGNDIDNLTNSASGYISITVPESMYLGENTLEMILNRPNLLTHPN